MTQQTIQNVNTKDMMIGTEKSMLNKTEFFQFERVGYNAHNCEIELQCSSQLPCGWSQCSADFHMGKFG